MNLRQKLCNQRRSLLPQALEDGSLAVADILSRHRLFRKAKRVASFIATNGEQDPYYLNLLSWQYNKTLVLPKLRAYNNRLWFVKYTRDSQMRLNRYSIPEPYKRIKLIPPWSLDLVLVPLVAFDKTGNRMGMGGGYYDISFESNFYRRKHPKMVGIAHSFQQVSKLKPNPWDVPLDAIVTEKELILC